MHHPKNRAERRHERQRLINRRKFIYLHIWQMEFIADPNHLGVELPEFTEWGRYDKWNLNCNSKMCHYAKYFKAKDKRRKALKESESQAEFRKRNKAV